MNVKTAVLPVAGKGTRFLPATKEIPKELIPIVNIPMINYVVDEVINSGLERIIFITSANKSAIEDFYDRNFALEKFLENNNKNSELELVKKFGTMVEFVSVRQREQLGLGHAVLCAKDLIKDDYFAVLLADDLVINHKNPVTKQLIDISNSQGEGSVIGVMEVPREQTYRYGIVDGQYIGDSKKTLKMTDMIEKPKPESAPTNLATPGRYILSKNIFSILETLPRGAGGEYQLTDAIKILAQREKVFAHVFDGQRYDTGSLEGYLEATIDFALERDDLSQFTKKLILNKAKSLS